MTDTDTTTQRDDDSPPEDELAYWAWTIIANVGHNRGGWEAQDPEWVEAAERWRDAFHASLDVDPAAALRRAVSTFMRILIDREGGPTDDTDDADALRAKLDRVATQAATNMWVTLQRDYRQSRATPPESSLGCEWAIEELRSLANELGKPDPRAVVEIGMEHLWEIVYGEPYGSTVISEVPVVPVVPGPEDLTPLPDHGLTLTPEDPVYFGDEGFEMISRGDSMYVRGVVTDSGPLHTPREWAPVTGIHVMDPDGWRRRCTGPHGIVYEPRDFEEPVTVSEYLARAMWSTTKRTGPEAPDA